MRIADFVRTVTVHLADDKHHDGHDESVTDKHDEVQCTAWQTEVFGAHHVPHEDRPDEHVRRHPRE